MKSRPGFGGQAGGPVLAFLLFALTVWEFTPCLRHGFVNFDDQVYVYENAHVQSGLTWEGFRWAFTNLEAGFWHPLTWLSVMFDCQIFGLRAGGHHLTSVLLHASSSVLLFLLFRSLTGTLWRSAFVAALFALHPLNVEPVAWVASRKDVLSTLFWMLAMLTYTRYAQERGRATPADSVSDHRPPTPASRLSRSHLPSSICYLLSLVFFGCGLMSKTMVVTLPFILLLLDWWPLRRLQLEPAETKHTTLHRVLLEKLPFFAAALAAGFLTMHAESEIGALAGIGRVSLPDRIANALLSYARYLLQVAWPGDLAVFYPYPQHFSLLAILGAVLLLTCVSVLAARTARRWRWLAFGWTWYLVTLLPVIGLIQIGSHAHADRYAYVPLLGVYFLLTWSACEAARGWRYGTLILSSTAVVLLGICAALSRQQLGYWEDTKALLRHTIAVTENNTVACNNLGSALVVEGRPDEALPLFEEAARLNPGDAGIQDNLGTALVRLGRLGEAVTHLREAVRLAPRHAGTRNDLGAALGRVGELAEAVEQLQIAVKLTPSDAGARCNLGDALASQRRLEEAIAQYREALKLNPGYPEAHCNLGLALSQQGRFDEAILHLEQAVRLRPDFGQAQNILRAVQEQRATLASPLTPPKP